MDTKTIAPFQIIGITVRTTNENNQAAKDIPLLWQMFMSENTVAGIPNKIDSTVYAVYCEYEGDYTKPYTTLLGCKVASLDEIPQGMTSKTIAGGPYACFLAKGDLMQGAVFNAWVTIWNTLLERRYTEDFEVYDERSGDPSDATVPIFVGVSEKE